MRPLHRNDLGRAGRRSLNDTDSLRSGPTSRCRASTSAAIEQAKPVLPRRQFTQSAPYPGNEYPGERVQRLVHWVVARLPRPPSLRRSGHARKGAETTSIPSRCLFARLTGGGTWEEGSPSLPSSSRVCAASSSKVPLSSRPGSDPGRHRHKAGVIGDRLLRSSTGSTGSTRSTRSTGSTGSRGGINGQKGQQREQITPTCPRCPSTRASWGAGLLASQAYSSSSHDTPIEKTLARAPEPSH